MSDTLTLVKKNSFYQDVVLKALAAMEKGTLHLSLPDGETLTMGTCEGHITAHINIVDDEFYKRVILYGDIGFGEAYVDGFGIPITLPT
jgi:cyclopropane-fatty-acyl-phospholipid synthase